jgi:hypothetical protein
MAKYRVAFEGQWQCTFDDRDDAIAWASDVGETGRLVYVVKRGWCPRLIAVFPRSRADEARATWAQVWLKTGN